MTLITIITSLVLLVILLANVVVWGVFGIIAGLRFINKARKYWL